MRLSLASDSAFIGPFSQGRVDSIIFGLGLGVLLALSFWIMYLRRTLARRGLDAVSWYDMPSRTRRAGSREQRWLAQWRLATMAQLVVSVVFLLVVAALLTGRLPHYSAATATVKAQPTATATPNLLAGIGPIVNSDEECWVSSFFFAEIVEVTGPPAKNVCTTLVNGGGYTAIAAS